MKVRCLDPDTFLLTMKQHTILVNCPLKTRQSQQDETDTETDLDETADYATTLDSVLAPYHPLAKQAALYSTDTTRQKQQRGLTWSRMIALDGIDISTIDVILLTHHEHLLGLPYLTEYLGYQGKIVATEPTIEFARQRMEELVHYRSTNGASSSFIGAVTGDDLTMEWQSIYTLKDIASCIEKIQPVRYNERMSLFSTLDVMAYSSGYSLGSSNWLIETSMKKIVVLSSSSSRPELHPALLDHTLIHSADVILVSGVSLDDHPTPTFERQVKKCLSHIAGTLGARHNVILPISITGGLVYDLIWMIDSHLRTLGMELGHESHQIPMYMISPMAEQSLQYANICGEWMTNECQEQLWVPNMPLPHGGLMKSGALTTFTTMASIPLSKTKNLLSSPCLVFTGDHQVLSHGALDWFMQNWGTDSNNLCLFTDSNMSDEQLQQYDKVDMAIMHLPLDTRLTMKQVLDWIRLYWKTITTKHLILPRTAATTSLLHGDSFGLNNVHTQLYSSGEMIDINLGFEWEHISISSQLARDIKPVQVPWMTMTNETKQMAHISGDLQVYNNQLILHRMTSHLNTNLVLLSSSTHTHSLDSISVSDLRNKLHKIGMNDITMEQNNQCLILAFRSSPLSRAINRLELVDELRLKKYIFFNTLLLYFKLLSFLSIYPPYSYIYKSIHINSYWGDFITMEKASTTKPPKPSIGLKLQNSPFLANTQSNTPNNNLKSAPVKKKTTTPAWLQKQEFSSFKRASLQKMSQKVSSNPWKKDNSTSLPTSKLPTPTANSNKSSSSSTKTLPTKIKGPPLNKPQGTRHSIQKAKVKGDQKASGSAHGVGTSTMGSVPESGGKHQERTSKATSTKPVEEPVIQSRLATPSTTLVEKSSIDTDSSIIHNTSQVPSDNDNQPINTKSPLPVQSTQMSVTRSSSTPEPASPAISESPSSSSLIVKVENSTDLSPSLPALYQQQEASLADITNFNNLSEITLPWSQHTQEQLQQIEKQQHAAITTDYDTFFQQLVVSHAISSALYFPTVSFDQAQKLHKRYLKSNDHIDMIGTRLLTETKAQRMILSMHKLSTTHTSSAMPDLVEEKESDRLDQVDRLVEELIQWMHRDYSRREQYLQHLAGTLAKQCTHLEQINHSITGNSSLLTLSMTQNTTDAIIMMKKETQWILALRHDIIQLFEHHLPTVTLPPSPVTSPSQSISTMSSSSSSAIGGSNEEEGDLFLNSNRTSMTSATTDHQQAHLYHRHHQNMVSEIKHLIQLLDQQLASRQVGMTPTEELETKLANEKQLNDTLAGQVTKLQEKWDQEVERNQALVDGLRSEHTRLTVALDEEKRRTQQLETRLGNHRQEQEEDQDKLDHLEACLAQEKQQGAALQTRLELANKELAYQMEERDRLVLELQSQLANDIQHQRSLVNQYFSDGDATVEMALAQLCKERDDARMESQGWQAKAEGLNVELDEWQTKAEGLDKERQEWQTKAEGLDKERQEWRIKAEGLDKERQEWQTKAEGLELELETTHRTMTTLQNDQSASALQVNALETRLQQLSKDKQNLEDQQTLSDDRLAEAQQQIQALTVKIADLEQDDWRQKYKDLETRFDMAQQQFTHRESGYLLQSASVEAELEQVLKEYDRLTRHIVDFNSERKKYEQQISDMNQYQHRLDQQLADLQVQHLGDSQGTTMALRKEFRQLMAHTKATYQQELDKEQQLRSTLEQERRAEKQEVERLRWDRVNVSVQTHFVV